MVTVTGRGDNPMYIYIYLYTFQLLPPLNFSSLVKVGPSSAMALPLRLACFARLWFDNEAPFSRAATANMEHVEHHLKKRCILPWKRITLDLKIIMALSFYMKFLHISKHLSENCSTQRCLENFWKVEFTCF